MRHEYDPKTKKIVLKSRIQKERAEALAWVKLGEMNGLLRAADMLGKWGVIRMGLKEMRDELRMMALVEGSSVHECNVEERP